MNAEMPQEMKYVSLLWAGPDRAAEIAKLRSNLFAEPWSEGSVGVMLDNPASTAFIAFDGLSRQAVGFIMGQLAADEAEILSIGVAQGWQRMGIGTRMMEGLTRALERAEIKRLFLDVAADNDAAMALYLKRGFAAVGMRKGYYKRKDADAMDALTLALDIGKMPNATL
jgi:[ribosomal protein S18]-alanine N-acetyltransferase